jgi:hypothetical protein
MPTTGYHRDTHPDHPVVTTVRAFGTASQEPFRGVPTTQAHRDLTDTYTLAAVCGRPEARATSVRPPSDPVSATTGRRDRG